jgi:hypothetical protein
MSEHLVGLGFVCPGWEGNGNKGTKSADAKTPNSPSLEFARRRETVRQRIESNHSGENYAQSVATAGDRTSHITNASECLGIDACDPRRDSIPRAREHFVI